MNVCIASVKSREASLVKTLDSLKGVTINLFLNNYDTLPDWLDKYPVGQVELSDNRYGASGKFFFQSDGYNFTCDDDIIYPEDYFRRTIHHIEKYNRRAVVSYHGKRVNGKVKSYYAYTQNFACRDTLENDVRVHIPGIGVMGWHSDTIKFDFAGFKRKNMVDIWAGKQCHEKGVKVYCVAHDAGYFGFTHHKESIWQANHKNDSYQTEVVNSVKWE